MSNTNDKTPAVHRSLDGLVGTRSQRFQRGGVKNTDLGYILDRKNSYVMTCNHKFITEMIWLLNRGEEVRRANENNEFRRNNQEV